MINDLSELLKKEIGPELSSKFDLNKEKSFSIIDTITETVKKQRSGADLGTLASGLSSMISKNNGLEDSVIANLVKNEGLKESLAIKIKDFVLPYALDYLKNKIGTSKLGNMLGSQGISNFKF